MNLLIDIGNTTTKMACISDGQLKWQDKILGVPQQLHSWAPVELNPRFGIISSTKHIDKSALTGLVNQLDYLIFLDDQTPLPYKNAYSTPQSLGRDRMAAVAGAKPLFPDRPVLVIDAGTCITFDIITADECYLGGSIAPGIEMRFKALQTFTDKLPLVKIETPVELIGDSTKQSILSGVVNGVMAEIDGLIDQYKSRFAGLVPVITGGDAHLFEIHLKNKIFAAPNLVLKGLHAILEYNVTKSK